MPFFGGYYIWYFFVNHSIYLLNRELYIRKTNKIAPEQLQHKGFEIKLKNGLKLNFKAGEKVKVSPVGDVIGLDGRGFKVDGDVLLNSIQANGLDIPLDANHSFDEALGWFPQESFELRSDGLYATLEFNAKGIEANTNKSYRYLSPVYVMADNRMVAELDSVGFVNRPNLLNNALNNKEQNSMTIEELKADIDAKIETINGITQTITENITTFEANNTEIQNEVKTMKTEITELNNKMSIFGKPNDYDPNHSDGDLTDGEKAAAKALGLSEENYKKAKEDN